MLAKSPSILRATLACAAVVSSGTATPLTQGIGTFVFDDLTGASDPNTSLNVFYYRPDVVTADTPVWFSLHGASRNAESARNNFVSAAAAQGAIVIAPEFSEADFPTSTSYNLGNITTSESSGVPIPQRDWSFSKIEPLFDLVVDSLVPETDVQDYFLFGHSAGAQFTHRFLQYTPDARVRLAVAANAGWWTLPQYRSADYPYDWPYTLNDSPGAAYPEAELERFLGENLVVLLGDQDQARNNLLRTNTQADAQGVDRLERGQLFFERGQSQAATRGVDFGWDLQILPGVDHSSRNTAVAAAELFRLANLAPGDYDQDGFVGEPDFGVWRSTFGAEVPAGSGADGNGDGIVDAADYTVWRDHLEPPRPTNPAYYYVGAAGGDFFDEANWNTDPAGGGTAPANGSIEPGGSGVSLDLLIDGVAVSANATFVIGEAGAGSLILLGGARLDAGFELTVDPDGALVVRDSTLDAVDTLDLRGRGDFLNASVIAGNDIEVRPYADITATGSVFDAADNLEFFVFSEASQVSNNTFRSADRLGLNSDSVNVVMTDATIVINGGAGDVEDLAGDLTDDAGVLTLLGDSSLVADDVEEGARLVLGDRATADVGNSGSNAYVGSDGSTITLISTDAALTVPALTSQAIDPRDHLINGLTGLTYAQDPGAWSPPAWNGLDAVTLRLAPLSTAVPEPGAAMLVALAGAAVAGRR